MQTPDQKSFKATRDEVKELNLVVRKKYESLRVRGLLKIVDANTHKPVNRIINKDACMFTEIAVTGEEIYAIHWGPRQVRVTTTLHNNYYQTLIWGSKATI